MTPAQPRLEETADTPAVQSGGRELWLQHRMLALVAAVVLLVYGRLLFGHVLFASDTFPYLLGERLLIRNEWLRLQLPVMNPYILCGSPVLENIVAGALYPLNVFLLFGSPLWGFHCFVVVHYLLSALAAYRFLRRGLELEPWACATGAVVYACGGYLWSVPDKFFFLAGPWVPLFFTGLLRLTRDLADGHRPRGVREATGALVMLLLCGNFQQGLDAVAAGGLLVAIASATHMYGDRRHAARRSVLWFAGVLALAALLALPQLLPTALAAMRSYRAAGLPLAEAQEWSLPPARLIELLVPFFFGAPQQDGLALNRFYGIRTAWSLSLTIGMPLLLTLCLVRVRYHRHRRSLWMLLVALGGLLMALGRYTPLYAFCYQVVPGFSVFRHPEKYVYWLNFGLLSLGALGLSRLHRHPDLGARVWRFARLLLIAVGAIWLLLAGVVAYDRDLYAGAAHQLGSRWDWIRLFGWQSSQIALSLACLAIFAHLIQGGEAHGACRWWRRPGPLAFALTAAHLLVASWLIQWTIPVQWVHGTAAAERFVPAEQRSLYRVYSDSKGIGMPQNDLAKDYPRPARCLGAYARLEHNGAATFQLRTTQGFSALMAPEYVDYTDFSQHSPPHVLRLCAARYALLPTQAVDGGLPSGLAVTARDTTFGISVVEDPLARPRIDVVTRHVIPDGASPVDTAFQLAATARPGEISPVVITELPRHYIEHTPADDAFPPTVLQDEPGRIAAACQGPGWLVLRDWRLPGWKARLDGTAPVEISEADGGFMAVFVPVGQHEVQFRYAPPGLRLGACVSLVTALLLILKAGWSRIRPGA